MNFFTTFKNSFYGPEMYASMKERSVGSALLYLFQLTSLIALVAAGLAAYFTYSVLLPMVQKFVSESIIQAYPSELVISIDNGVARTNLPGPHIINDPTQSIEGMNFIVIDTSEEFSIENFDDRNAAIWLAQDAVVLAGDKPGEAARFISLEEVGTLQIDHDLIKSGIQTVLNYLGYLTIFAGVGTFIAFLLAYFFFNIVYALILAFVVKLVTNASGSVYSYSTAYTATLIAMTPALLFNIVTWFVPMLSYPFVFSLIVVLVIAINLSQAKPTDSDTPSESSASSLDQPTAK